MRNRRYRHKLKKKLKEPFPDQLSFLTTKLNTVEIVVRAKYVSSCVLSDDMSCFVEAAKCLQEDILRYCEQLPQTSWTRGQNISDTMKIMHVLLISFHNSTTYFLKSYNKNHYLTKPSFDQHNSCFVFFWTFVFDICSSCIMKTVKSMICECLFNIGTVCIFAPPSLQQVRKWK